MNQNNQEQEVKFYLARRADLEKRLLVAGAMLHQPRTFEVNLRFDTPTRDLARVGQVLRLRQDERVRLTYKSAPQPGSEVSSRTEIEFEASSFENAQAFLEALGYEVSIAYEKFRTTYRLGDVEVTIDELPFGDFAEIEGPDPLAIQAAAALAGLNWEARIQLSYLALFTRLCTEKNLMAFNLTFREVTQKYPPQAFGVKAADK